MRTTVFKILFVGVLVFFQFTARSQYVRYTIEGGDTIQIVDLPVVCVGSPYDKEPEFKNKRESYQYRKLTEYVKKVYPYAKLASDKLKECEAEIQRDPESKKKAMKKVEKALRQKYGTALKQLTVTQGKLLLLLIDRETGYTSFELVQELRGNFNASVYQGVALLFGQSLKLTYEPQGKHWMIEDIVQKIERGIIK